MQRPVNGRRDQDDPGLTKLVMNTESGFVSRARDCAPAVHRVIALMLIILSPLLAGAENGRSYLEMSGGYKTGDFGTTTRSELYYVSPTIGYVAPQYDVSVTVPYLNIANRIYGVTTSESGTGDVILRGGGVFVPEGDGGFSLDGALAVKLPTADRNKGLGTGETDYGAFLSVHQRFDKIKLSFLAGYIKVGDPPSVNYNDIYLYGVGIARIIGSTELYTSFEGRRATVPGAKNPQEINVGFFHVLNAEYAIKGGAFSGLNNGGPDFGLSAGIVVWF
ncbi:MAG TPA: hypothetical protein VN604_03845 [Nitrospirota bacterium]|nr:hypothetical protein [Nitrospirota bacterium]